MFSLHDLNEEQLQSLLLFFRALAEYLQHLGQEMDGQRDKETTEKDDSPHTPLSDKEKKEKEKGACFHACARKPFFKPSAKEVQGYLDEIGEKRFTGEEFVNYYEGVDWQLGQNRPMRNWKAVVRTWQGYQRYAKNKDDNGTAKSYETTAERLQRVRQEQHASFEQGIRQRLARGKMQNDVPR